MHNKTLIKLLLCAGLYTSGAFAQDTLGATQVPYFRWVFSSLQSDGSDMAKTYEMHLTEYLGLNESELNALRIASRAYVAAEKTHHDQIARITTESRSVTTEGQARVKALDADLASTARDLAVGIVSSVRPAVATQLLANASLTPQAIQGGKK